MHFAVGATDGGVGTPDYDTGRIYLAIIVHTVVDACRGITGVFAGAKTDDGAGRGYVGGCSAIRLSP